METSKILSLLSMHGVEHSVTSGKIMALDSIDIHTGESFYIDVTGFSLSQIKSFLGY